MECVDFEEAGFFCVPPDFCNESGVIKANYSEQFEPRYSLLAWDLTGPFQSAKSHINMKSFHRWNGGYLEDKTLFTWVLSICDIIFQFIRRGLQFQQQHRLWIRGVLSPWQVIDNMILLSMESVGGKIISNELTLICPQRNEALHATCVSSLDVCCLHPNRSSNKILNWYLIFNI